MIRINLLRPSYEAPAAKAGEGRWVSRREVWGAVALLAVAAVLLYYLGSHARPLMQTSRTPPPSSPPAKAATAPEPSPPPQEAKSTPPAEPKREAAPPQKSAEPRGPVEAREVVIERRPEALTITVRASAGELIHRSMKLDKPNRIVIDLQNCKLTAPVTQRTQAVEHPRVTRVRMSQFQVEPPVCRIVLDVASFPRYEVIPGPEGLRIRVLDANQ